MPGRGVTAEIQESSSICQNKSADYDTMNGKFDMILDQPTLMKKGAESYNDNFNNNLIVSGQIADDQVRNQDDVEKSVEAGYNAFKEDNYAKGGEIIEIEKINEIKEFLFTKTSNQRV